MKTYPICLEISGPTAIWARPDTGDSPVSYPAPTFSAARGIFESIVWLQSAEVAPTKVEICAPLVYHNYSTNYGGPPPQSGHGRPNKNTHPIATRLFNRRYPAAARVPSPPR